MLIKDQTTIVTLCSILKIAYLYDEDLHIGPLNGLFFIGWSGHTNNVPEPKFTGCMLENDAAKTILLALPRLSDSSDIYWAVSLLVLFIMTQFENTRFFERSVKWKGNIFSKLPFLIKVTEKLDRSKNERVYNSMLDIFQYYLISQKDEVAYCRPVVRSHIQDGTLCKLVKIFSDGSDSDGFIDTYLVDMIRAVYTVTRCDINTVYSSYNYEIFSELRILNRIAIDNLSVVAKNNIAFVIFLKTIIAQLQKDDKEDRDYFVKQKLFQKLTHYMVIELRSKNIQYDKLMCLLDTLTLLRVQLEQPILYEDFHWVIKYLPHLINPQKHSAAYSLTDYLKKAMHLTNFLVAASGLLKEDNLIQLRTSGFISLLVQNAKIFHTGLEIDNLTRICVWESIWVCLLCNKGKSLNLSLTDIDQLLPGIPLCLELISQKDTDNYPIIYSITEIIGNVLALLMKNLKSIKDDGRGQISSQLLALVECDFVCGIGKALIPTENLKFMYDLVEALDFTCDLMGTKEVIEKFIDYLPDLADKQKHYVDIGGTNSKIDADLRKNFTVLTKFIFIKAAAYVLDDIDPALVPQVMIANVLYLWKTIVLKDMKMFFTPYPGKTEEEFEIFIDVLKATWNMTYKFPDIIYSEMPELIPSLFGKPLNLEDSSSTMCALIIKVVISYLDHSHEYSLTFLIKLTTFVKDLSDDTVSSGEKKALFQDLKSACQRFLRVNNNRLIVENVNYFVEFTKND